MQTPVSNTTFDDHTESGQSVSHVVMNVMLTLQINLKKKQPTEWKMVILWLFSHNYDQPQLLYHGQVCLTPEQVGYCGSKF